MRYACSAVATSSVVSKYQGSCPCPRRATTNQSGCRCRESLRRQTGSATTPVRRWTCRRASQSRRYSQTRSPCVTRQAGTVPTATTPLHAVAVAEQAVAVRPAHDEPERECQCEVQPGTTRVAAIPDVQHAPPPGLRADLQKSSRCSRSWSLARGPRVVHQRICATQGGPLAPLQPHRQQANPAPTRDKQRTCQRMIESRLEARQAVRFARTHRSQIRRRAALWFLQHTRIPDQQRRLLAHFQHGQPPGRVSPEVQALPIRPPTWASAAGW